MVNNRPVMQETRVRSLGWVDPLEKEMAIHSSILAWRIPWTEDLVGYSPWGHKELDTTEQLTLSLFNFGHTTIRQLNSSIPPVPLPISSSPPTQLCHILCLDQNDKS